MRNDQMRYELRLKVRSPASMLDVEEGRRDDETPTVVDDAVLQKSLTQVNPFLGVARLTNLHQPGHKLTGDAQNTTPTYVLHCLQNAAKIFMCNQSTSQQLAVPYV